MAALRSRGTMVCIVAIFASPMMLSGVAHVGQALLSTQQTAAAPTNPLAVVVAEASKPVAVPEHWIGAAMRVECDERKRAPSRKSAKAFRQVDVEKAVTEHEISQKAFPPNRERLKAERLAREAELKAKGK